MTQPATGSSIPVQNPSEVWRYELLKDTDAVRKQIRECEGQHVQQAIFSTYMDTLTQVCFTEQVVRSTIRWEGSRSWYAGS
jgi:hypothetical protein